MKQTLRIISTTGSCKPLASAPNTKLLSSAKARTWLATALFECRYALVTSIVRQGKRTWFYETTYQLSSTLPCNDHFDQCTRSSDVWTCACLIWTRDGVACHHWSFGKFYSYHRGIGTCDRETSEQSSWDNLQLAGQVANNSWYTRLHP
jgi:hypothetical protein